MKRVGLVFIRFQGQTHIKNTEPNNNKKITRIVLKLATNKIDTACR